MNATNYLSASVLLGALLHLHGCCNPGNIDADPDCPAGRLDSATLDVNGELDGIRPVDANKDIQVRGNRVSTDPCIQAGAQSAFSLRLRGDDIDHQIVGNLAPGAWTVNVTALSGGDHAAINRTLALPAGGSVSLVVSSTQDGDMVLE
jgi:hypothetical protein